MDTRKYLYGHVDEDSAYIVEDYPWGFTTRTKARFWVETVDKKRGGERFVKQTLNPKTDRWCKPKKSVYSSIIVMYLDADDHVTYDDLTCWDASYEEDRERFDAFFETHKEHLTDYQNKKMKMLQSYKQALKDFKYKSTVSQLNFKGGV